MFINKNDIWDADACKQRMGQLSHHASPEYFLLKKTIKIALNCSVNKNTELRRHKYFRCPYNNPIPTYGNLKIFTIRYF